LTVTRNGDNCLLIEGSSGVEIQNTAVWDHLTECDLETWECVKVILIKDPPSTWHCVLYISSQQKFSDQISWMTLKDYMI